MKKNKVFRPYSILQIPQIESWLRKQAIEGYRLIALKGYVFTFAKCSSQEREYFLYKSPLLAKPDKFNQEFYYFKSLYSLQKSELNNNVVGVFEADLKKINKEYSFCYRARSKFYLTYHIKVIFLKLFSLLFSILFLIFKAETLPLMLPIAIVNFFATLYSFVAIVILKTSLKRGVKY